MVSQFENIYRMFLEEVTAELPNVKWVLCEPFVLDCGVVVEGWRDEIDQRRAVVAKVRPPHHNDSACTSCCGASKSSHGACL